VPAYTLGAILSAVTAVCFLAGLGIWAPALQPLLGTPAVAVSFVLAAGAWAVWVMQGSVLVAVGRAGATTWTNQLFNGLKLLLLAAFVAVLPSSGVWFAWAAAVGVGIATGTWFLFRRAIPAFSTLHGDAAPQVPSLRDFVRFAGPDYVAALAWIACTSLAPILVLNLTDARHAAVFALGWSICLVLYAVPGALGQSLVAHGTREPAQLPEQHRRILISSFALLGPVVVILVVFAPWILQSFGAWYAARGAGTLRLLSLSALPNAVVSLTVSRARVNRRMTTIVATMTTLCFLVLGLTWLLVPRIGIIGGGAAWLLGQVVVVGALAARQLRRRSPTTPGAGG
jgi:O-antigen/teichoic acid export membrane protein